MKYPAARARPKNITAVYLSGQITNDRFLPIQEQTHEVRVNIDKQLAPVGNNKSRLLSETIWLNYIRELDLINEIWEACVDTTLRPDNLSNASCRAGVTFRDYVSRPLNKSVYHFSIIAYEITPL